MINKWIDIIIYQFLDNVELMNLIILHKQSSEKINDIYKQYNSNKLFITNYFYQIRLYSTVLPSFKYTLFPEKLIRSFNQFYPLQTHHVGSTDYIDRVKCKDMNSSIMIGCDQYSRAYICIRYICNETNYKNWNGDDCIWKKTPAVLTCFQRYTNGKAWCKAGSGSYYNMPLLYGSETYLNKANLKLLIKNILRLLCNEPIEVLFPVGYNDEYRTRFIKCSLV